MERTIINKRIKNSILSCSLKKQRTSIPNTCEDVLKNNTIEEPSSSAISKPTSSTTSHSKIYNSLAIERQSSQKMSETMELELQDMSSHISSLNKTPVSIVQEYASRNHLVPQYDLIFNGMSQNKMTFKYSLILDQYVTVGEGSSKKEAKHEAALRLLKQMIDDKPELLNNDFKEWDFDNHVISPFDKNIKENAVGKLNDICTNNRLGLPEFKLVREEGQAHAKLFTISCQVSKMIEAATHKTKKQAKHLAATRMVNKLMTIDKSLVSEMKTEVNVPDSSKVLEQVEMIKKDHVKTLLPMDECMSVFHYLFQKKEWLNTATLKEQVKQFNGDCVKTNDPVGLLSKIVDECGMKLVENILDNEILKHPNYFISLTLENIHPPVAGLGMNVDFDVAKCEAATNLLTAICLLYK